MILGPDLWTRIKQRIAERRQQEVDLIAGGRCSSMEAYADHVGVVRALDWVLTQAHDLANAPQARDQELD